MYCLPCYTLASHATDPSREQLPSSTGTVEVTEIEKLYFTWPQNIVARTATIWHGVWTFNWIYWTQLNYTTRDYTSQFTVRHTHTNLLSPGVFSLVFTAQLSHKSAGPRTSCRPTRCLQTPSSLTHGNPLPQPGSSILPLARTHWLPNQDCNSGGPVHRFLVTVFQYRRILSFRIRWHIHPKTVILEGLFTLTTATATLLCRQTSSHYDRRPIGQWVLVSSPVWGSWPDVNYCLTVTVLSPTLLLVIKPRNRPRRKHCLDTVEWAAVT
jgi:hypothetical protein